MDQNFENRMKQKLIKLKNEYQRTIEMGKKDFESMNTNDGVRDAVARGEALDQVDRSGLLEVQNKERLRRIQSALHKLEYGEYGMCETCGAELDEDRLEAAPESPFCFSCEKRRE